MRKEIEKRLHRVMINLDTEKVTCPYSEECIHVSNCPRCNEFYKKCSYFMSFH